MTQGTLFTSAIVDLIHGRIKKDHHSSRYFHTLVESILVVSEQNLLCVGQSTSNEINQELWNQICQSRRILQRIKIAVNGILHREALSEGSTSVGLLIIRQLNDLYSQVTSAILAKARGMRNIQSTTTIAWYEFAIAYEATIIMRAQGNVGAAIELADICQNMEIRIESQNHHSEIQGLFGFNFNLISDIAKLSDDAVTPQSLLFRLSKRISRNSKHAASRGLNQGQEDTMIPFIVLQALSQITSDERFQINHSAILHFEGLIRVCAYHSSWDGEMGNINRLTIPLIINDINDKVLGKEISNCKIDNWLKELLKAKVEEDIGCLFSDILPSLYLDDEYAKSKISDSDSPIISSINGKIDDAWEAKFDSPAIVRTRFRRAAIEDMEKRASALEQGSSNLTLTNLFRTVGDFSDNNPLTSGSGLASFLSPNKKSDNNMTDREQSRHMRHFPQGNLNRAQIAISMSFMQSISRRDKSIFSEEYILSKKGSGKIQYTRGHFNTKDGVKPTLSNPSSNENILGRKKLTRVNRFDEMMFVANAMNFVFDVIESELSDKLSSAKRFDRVLRECRIDTLLNNLELPKNFENDLPHIHELIYFAEEASSSPMRIIDYMGGYSEEEEPTEEKELKEKFERIDRVLRVSFARIYCLSLRLEHLSRLLLEKPLREPFFSSCVLITEQVRLMLEFIHEDWIEAYRTNSEMGEPTLIFEHEVFKNAKELTNPKRKNIFGSINAQDLSDKEVKPDVAVEYLLSTCLNKSNLGEVYKHSKKRLDFSNSIGEEWDNLLDHCTKMRYEGSDNFELGKLAKGLGKANTEANKSSLDDVDSILPSDPLNKSKDLEFNEVRAIEAYKIIRQHTKREWVYWARLVFAPTAFVGRVMVSANTPRDMNREENATTALPLLSLKLKRGIEQASNEEISKLIESNLSLLQEASFLSSPFFKPLP